MFDKRLVLSILIQIDDARPAPGASYLPEHSQISLSPFLEQSGRKSYEEYGHDHERNDLRP